VIISAIMELRLVNTPHKPVTQASERRSKKSPKTGSQWLNKPEWLEAGARREASAPAQNHYEAARFRLC
jgi:hypothetical protein